MLLIFYGLQIALNSVTDALGMAQFDIDPMIAGIITLGFIYGAYFTETFRGAYPVSYTHLDVYKRQDLRA